jgi:2-polyprenyl-3-methyl-5-hydroxy-6-metoxy-1,4-benzoquinol methylase
MGDPARWQERVEEFVLGQIGDLPARVLEVGCGEGELARALAYAGHSVTAIDPRAPEGTIFRRVRLEEFSEPGPFDYVVASQSLHHVEDLGRALEKVTNLLRAGGALIVVERARGGERGGRDHGDHAGHAEAHFAGWVEEGFHDFGRMRDELGRRFVERHFEWVPYLYPDLDEGTSEADESAAIEVGAINATGFRYVGTLALEEEHF